MYTIRSSVYHSTLPRYLSEDLSFKNLFSHMIIPVALPFMHRRILDNAIMYVGLLTHNLTLTYRDKHHKITVYVNRPLVLGQNDTRGRAVMTIRKRATGTTLEIGREQVAIGYKFAPRIFPIKFSATSLWLNSGRLALNHRVSTYIIARKFHNYS